MTRTVAVSAVALLAACSMTVQGQMPGLPTLQNAWANPGFTAGINGGTGGGSQTVGGAVAWAPSSGRFLISAGGGGRKSDLGGRGGAYGVRAAMPVASFAGGALGVAGFLGVGGAREPDAEIGFQDGGTLTQVPIGVGIGYRRAFSFIRGASVYATPFYSYNRLTVGDNTITRSLFRVGLGIDVGITNTIGVTAGAELGSNGDEGGPGPSGAVFGVGASYALGRR